MCEQAWPSLDDTKHLCGVTYASTISERGQSDLLIASAMMLCVLMKFAHDALGAFD
jgi:hypothetical protein